MKYPAHLQKLIQVLRKLPGVGQKSAERFAFQILAWKPEQLHEMADVFKAIPHTLLHCLDCGCLAEGPCSFCLPERQQEKVICIIASPRDAFSIEETHEYFGLYHVLQGLLSPMKGMGKEHLRLELLRSRIQKLHINEVIIALDSTLEGDATSLYLKQELADLPVSVSRLAFGIPMGSSLDYIDGSTLARAFCGRGRF